MGDRANGPIPCAKETAVESIFAEALQKGFQFCNTASLAIRNYPSVKNGKTDRADLLRVEARGHGRRASQP